MKIAYLTNQYPHVRHTFIRREILALESLGVDVLRFSIRDCGHDCIDPEDVREYQRTESILKVGLLRLFFGTMSMFLLQPVKWLRAFTKATRLGRRSGSVMKHWVYFSQACWLRKRLRQLGVQHLHIHFATNPAVVGMLCQILGGPRFSITIHGPEEWDRPESLSLRDKYEAASFVVAVSDYGRCQVYRWCGVAHWQKVHVVRCGVDESYLKQEPTPVLDTNRLVLIAGLTEQKGHLLLLQALALVAKAGLGFEMIFVGDGPLRRILEEQIEKLQLSKQVTITGWQTGDQVRDHLRNARALIMPSLAENLPVAMMESLAMGRPVLSTYIAGVPELIEPGVTGWLVPAGNVQKTAEAIIDILQTSIEVLTRMGQAGRELVLEMHDAKKEAAKLKELFTQFGI